MSDKVNYKSCKGRVKANYIWDFEFFVPSICPNNLSQFEQAVKNCLAPKKMEIADLFKKENKHELKCLVSLYNSNINSILNNTSLVLYHKPDNSYFLKDGATLTRRPLLHKQGDWASNYQPINSCGYSRSPSGNIYYESDGHSKRVTLIQLLTGDANLSKDSEYIDDMINQFNGLSKLKNSDDILISLVPHHGSVKNMDESTLKKISTCRYWIASSGLSSQYKHPSGVLIKQILAAKKEFLWCNENQRLCIRAEFTKTMSD